MAASSDLRELLRNLDPVLRRGEYVFCSVGDDALVSRAIGMFREEESVTLIFERTTAEELGFAYSSVLRLITLRVESSLEAVGLTVAVARALEAEGIAANVVAAFHHDHVFIPANRAGDAIRALQRLQADAQAP